MLANVRKPQEEQEEAGKPTLRRRGSGRIDSEGDEEPQKEDEEERPKLKRRF